MLIVFNLKNLPKAVLVYRLSLAYTTLVAISFIQIAIASRFSFNILNSETKAFWLILCGPINWKKYLFYKSIFSLILIITITVPLTYFSAVYLKVNSNVTFKITLFSLLYGLLIHILAVYEGSKEPKFDISNPVENIISFRSLIFMIYSILIVIILTLILTFPHIIRFNPLWYKYVKKLKNYDKILSFIISLFLCIYLIVRKYIESLRNIKNFQKRFDFTI